MEPPEQVVNSRLFSKLKEDDQLLGCLISMRSVVLALAETTTRTVPNFTDHTIRHMDALWKVADEILTQDEVSKLSPAEAFVLASGFYLHDIGMAYAATDEGRIKIRGSNPYRAFMAHARENTRTNSNLEARAIGLAVRSLHADAAKELATREIPGSEGRYLFEALSLRETWGPTCGEVASSHHWPLTKLEDNLGPQSDTPLPGNRKGDLLYVAACLRLIDYAHINRERAPATDRAFRGPLNEDSLVHWLAQEHVDGPVRADNDLVYRAAKPIADVEAWWLFYEMINGLDNEIRGVRRLLDRRREGLKRLSLNGVRGAASPEETAVLIPTAGFLPIEVSLRTGSIDRLVELLAGETLYGPNPMAAVRELIQNARDAVMLKAEVATYESEKATLSLPIRISLNTKSKPPTLEIVDHGVGMTKRVITDYLITLASDYWSSQFAMDFPQAAEKGFKSAGKFGIGFLSVFMLGTDVTVESNRAGGERFQLSLRGVGRRGELRQLDSVPGSGTGVRVKVKPDALERITPLDTLVAVYAPTLPHSLAIDVDGTKVELPAGWLNRLDINRFQTWVLGAIQTIRQRSAPRSAQSIDDDLVEYRLYRHRFIRNAPDESTWPEDWPEYLEGTDRLIASFAGMSLLCLRGLAVQTVFTPGFLGVIDLDSAVLEASRNRTVNADVKNVLEKARQLIKPQVIKNLNALSRKGLMIDKSSFIAACVDFYGKGVVLDSEVPWISRLKMPGNVELISSQKLLKEIVDSSSIFVAFNTGPWTAMKSWAAAEPSLGDRNEVAVLIDGEGQGTPRYSTGGEKTVGPLASLWPEADKSPLFGTMLGLISQAWQTSQVELLSQDGWTHERSSISGRWQRP